MAATLAAAWAAPPPRRPEGGAGATAQWVVPGAGAGAGQPAAPQPPPTISAQAGVAQPAAGLPPLRARAVLTNRSAETQQPGPQRPLPARGLQPANRQVPALLFLRVRLAPAPKSGPYGSLCSRGSATPLSSPCPAQLRESRRFLPPSSVPGSAFAPIPEPSGSFAYSSSVLNDLPRLPTNPHRWAILRGFLP